MVFVFVLLGASVYILFWKLYNPLDLTERLKVQTENSKSLAEK